MQAQANRIHGGRRFVFAENTLPKHAVRLLHGGFEFLAAA